MAIDSSMTMPMARAPSRTIWLTMATRPRRMRRDASALVIQRITSTKRYHTPPTLC
jgi:hypothetical protein